MLSTMSYTCRQMQCNKNWYTDHLSVFSQSDHPTVSGCHQLMTKCECQFHGKESWQTQSEREKKLKLNLKGKKN